MLQSPEPVQCTENKELPCLRCPCFKVKLDRAFHLSTKQFLQPLFNIYMESWVPVQGLVWRQENAAP